MRSQNGQEHDGQQKYQLIYSLRAEQGHKMVMIIGSRKTRPLTYWRQNKTTKWSVTASAAERPGHLHPEGRIRPQNGQEQHWQQKDQTTYCLRPQRDQEWYWQQKDQMTHKLRAEQCHKMVRNNIGSRKTRLLTAWRQNKATKWSGATLAAERPDHWHTRSRTKPQNGQKQHWQQKDQTTYCLRQKKAPKWSGAALAAVRLDHLLPEGRSRWQNDQKQHWQQNNQITYQLKVE